MARAQVLSNGQFLVTLDRFGYVRDMHFPYVGLENHVSGQKHRIGIMVNDRFSWLDDGTWEINVGYKPETMVGYLVCKNPGLNISIVMEDIVYNETNVFLRQVDIYNNGDTDINVKIFFHQIFWIAENKKRNTAFFDPTHNLIVHYKGRRVFIVNGQTESGQPMTDYTVGAYAFEGKEGSYRDAEDGVLTQNAVEHGSVDSVVRFEQKIAGKVKERVYYWICAAKTLTEVYELNQMVREKTPEGMIHSTENYWHAWLEKRDPRISVLNDDQRRLFDTSLLVLRAHTDNRGSIIASADSEMIGYGKDDYTYMWPRDAAFIVSVLDKAGYMEVTKPFFNFCSQVLHPDGYLHHRFNSDQSLGSTWHSSVKQKRWLKDKILQLPIQEDESAAVLVALWKHYQASKDLEFVEMLFKPMIEKIAEFLVSFRDEKTGLPLASYDLWEEVLGVSTYTCSAVYGGLMAAANFSELLGKRNHMRAYKQAAKEVKRALIEYLYNQEMGAFVRYVKVSSNGIEQEKIVDASSLFGLWYFDVLDRDDPLFISTQKQTAVRLTNPDVVGGIIRYEHDNYFRDNTKPNPWLISTMWESLRELTGKYVTEKELQHAEKTLAWIASHVYASGILAEQLNPETGESLSATPLVWSRAVYVELVLTYLEQREKVRQAVLPKMPTPKEL